MNGGHYIKPTIISAIVKKFENSDETEIQKNKTQVMSQIIRPEVGEQMKIALHEVLEQNGEVGEYARIEGYNLGAKS